ncbi:major facilitator superfamily domain-containing protein [Aspergillus minisclerotigenes]|uniref:Major facilitator superfamily domain-containing protein n=1 Tax=Aspergillus minisclerotigenes TaxID=656917 RepID=A0A5N6JKS2_9EURO|nr:major facilitator superfamily domain-containing protein [Aspergillus minisclerotigenes]
MSSLPSPVTATDKPHRLEAYGTSYARSLLDQAGITQDVLEFRYRGSGTSRDPYVVVFIDNDPTNPLNFPQWKKWTITVLQAFAVLAVAFASTAYTSGVSEIMQEFQVSRTVAILGVTMFVFGFAFGPLTWAPLSELYGRQIVFFVTYMALAAFNAGTAGAPIIADLIIMRALAGTFGSSPLTNAGGVIADMFRAKERGIAMAIFAMAPFLGPSIGPIIAGFLNQSAGWRWVAGLMACLTGTLWIIISLSVRETYAPVILRRRAEKLSKLTGNIYISNLDIGKPGRTLGTEFKVALSRPWALLFTEPIVLFIRCAKVSDRTGGNLSPEARLPPAILGSILLPIGLFWFAWTNSTSIHWVVSIIGSGFFGCGQVLVFLSAMNYLIDSYVVYAASVLAANSILRSVFGAAFPLFTTSMYNTIGIHWASSIPAFLAFACSRCAGKYGGNRVGIGFNGEPDQSLKAGYIKENWSGQRN